MSDDAIAALREIAAGNLSAKDSAQIATLVLRRIEAAPKTEAAVAGYPAYRHDLSTSEINLIRRALRIYASSYQKAALESTHPTEKAQNKEYVAAADALGERLLRNGVPVTRVAK